MSYSFVCWFAPRSTSTKCKQKGRLSSGDPVSASLRVLRDDSGDAFFGGVIVVIIIRAKSLAHRGGNDTTDYANETIAFTTPASGFNQPSNASIISMAGARCVTQARVSTSPLRTPAMMR